MVRERETETNRDRESEIESGCVSEEEWIEIVERKGEEEVSKRRKSERERERMRE